jgi:hypothetical protein
MSQGPVDPHQVGGYWADRIQRMLEASVRDRALIPAEQVFDCRFDEFMRDDIGMVERIHAFAGQPFDAGLRQRLETYMQAHRRGSAGRVAYRLEDFGLSEKERRQALSHYQKAFDVPDE